MGRPVLFCVCVSVCLSLLQIMILNLDIKADTELRGSGFLPVQSGLWHSLLSAQWPRHSDPPWAAAEHCLVLCWVPLAQVTEQSLQELHSCHCPSTEAPTTTQQACPKWREKEGRQKWGRYSNHYSFSDWRPIKQILYGKLKKNVTLICSFCRNYTAAGFLLCFFPHKLEFSKIARGKKRLGHKIGFGSIFPYL